MTNFWDAHAPRAKTRGALVRRSVILPSKVSMVNYSTPGNTMMASKKRHEQIMNDKIDC